MDRPELSPTTLSRKGVPRFPEASVGMRPPSFMALVLLACAAGGSKAIPAPVQTKRDGTAFALLRPARLLEGTALSRVRPPQVGRARCCAQTQEYSTRRAMLASSAVMGAQAVLGVGGVSASTALSLIHI